MAELNLRTNRKDINKRISEGCGQGTGADYKPVIQVRDFSSKGLSTQGKGWKTGRIHHFLSTLEFSYFYALEWSPVVTDIREQYPLPIEETLEIAKQYNISHPINPDTQEPNVMTTDFVVTTRQNMGIVNQARTVKSCHELQKPRVLEKLEIERRYWELRNISWGIVTEREIPAVLVENVKWLHKTFHTSDLSPLSEGDIYQITALLTQCVIQEKASLKNIAAECDARLGLEIGDSLTVARHLIANRKWLIDMNQPLPTQIREKLIFRASPFIEPYR
jgi:hypothetical protein